MKDEKRKLFIFPECFQYKKLGGEIKRMTNRREWNIATTITGAMLSILMVMIAIAMTMQARKALNWIDSDYTFIWLQISQMWTFLFIGMSIIVALFTIAIVIVNQQEEGEKEKKEEEEQ